MVLILSAYFIYQKMRKEFDLKYLHFSSEKTKKEEKLELEL